MFQNFSYKFINTFTVFLLVIFSTKLYSQTFTNVATINGINHSLDSSLIYGAGVSFFDINNDGWDDITLIKRSDSLKILINNNGVFEPQYSGIYLNGEARQATWVDYDNDGDHDLFLSFGNGRLFLYNHDGNFGFQNVTTAAGLLIGTSPNYGLNFGDFNKDGHIDFYLSRYSYSTDSTDINEINLLFKNNGNGTFTNISQSAGVDNGNRFTFQGTWLDYDKDTWPDLYIINDRVLYHNYLFKNNGDETFSDVTLQSNTAAETHSPMSNTVGDYDNDGDLDIYMSNTGGIYLGQLFTNQNDGTFIETAQQQNVAIDKWSWGAVWIDVNNDSHQDLYVCTNETANELRNYLYLNDGNNYFIDSPQLFLDDHVASSFSVAKGDINNDGHSDMVVLNGNEYNSFLWLNGGTSNNWIKITLQGTVSNKMAIGSWITVWADGNMYTKYTMCGENYMSQNSQHEIFGLNQSAIVDSVVVQYLSGIIDKYYNLSVNEAYTFIEGETIHNNISYTDNLQFCAGDSVVLDAGIYNSYYWSTGSNQRFITVYNNGNYWVDVTNQQGLSIPSDTISIIVSPVPQISINAENISCNNLSDGTINLDIINQTNNFNIIWNNGVSNDSLINLSAGTYSYQYTDTFGCTASDSITIVEPYPFNIQTQLVHCTPNNLGSVQSIINGGTPPYQIFFNGNISGNLIDSLQPGLYSFEVIDQNLCSSIVPFEILFLTVSTDLNISNELEFYPNPAKSDELYIKCNCDFSSIVFYDKLGQRINYSLNQNKIMFNEIRSGLIFAEITINNYTIRKKVVLID